MNVYILMQKHEALNPGTHFFDRDTLRFFGERVSEMRVLEGTVTIKDSHGDPHECYVLSTLQRKNPCGPTRSYHYFDTTSFEEIIR